MLLALCFALGAIVLGTGQIPRGAISVIDQNSSSLSSFVIISEIRLLGITRHVVGVIEVIRAITHGSFEKSTESARIDSSPSIWISTIVNRRKYVREYIKSTHGFNLSA